MNKSENITELAQALAKAQAEMPHVPMNAVNPFLKNKFADLGAVITTIKPIIAKHGLSYSQLPVSDGNRVGITTVVMHASGQWIESTVMLELADEKGKSAAQVAGSVITYLRRYSLSSAFGLYADEDTDGNPAAKQAVKAPTKQTVRDRYSELLKEAVELGAVKESDWELNDKMTDAEITELGKQLRDVVNKAKAGK